MSRYKLTIEYDGKRYSGCQMQKGGMEAGQTHEFAISRFERYTTIF